MWMWVAGGVCLLFCAVWPWWLDLVGARIDMAPRQGPVCRTCRCWEQHREHAVSNPLRHTCEGALVKAVAEMGLARRTLSATLGAAGTATDGGSHAGDSPLDLCDDTELELLVASYTAEQHRKPLLAPVARISRARGDVTAAALMFGVPFGVAAITGTALLAVVVL